MDRIGILKALRGEIEEIRDRLDPPDEAIKGLKEFYWQKENVGNKSRKDIQADFDQYLKLAQNDPVAYDYLCKKVCDSLLLDDYPPNCMRLFAIDVLSGRFKRPVRRGRNAAATPLRNRMIVRLVKKAVELGCTATRNDASDHDASACDLVAAALKPALFMARRG